MFNPVFNRNLTTDTIRFLHSVNIYDLAAGFWTGANVLPGQQPGYAPAGIKMQGFIVFDFAARHPEAVKDLAGWLAAGKLKYRETIAQGVEAAPGAFIGLLAGANTGKQLVKLI